MTKIVLGVEARFSAQAATGKGESTYASPSSRLLIADVLEVGHEVRHRLFRHHSDLHGFDVVLNRIRLSEVEAAHRVKLLIRTSRLHCDRFFDDTALILTWLRPGALHVDHGVSLDVLAG